MIGGDGINDESNKTAPAPIQQNSLSTLEPLKNTLEWLQYVGRAKLVLYR